jgi:hypothetical protein
MHVCARASYRNCSCVFAGFFFVCVFICWHDFVDLCGCACGLDFAHDTRQRNAVGASGVMCRVLSLVVAYYS